MTQRPRTDRSPATIPPCVCVGVCVCVCVWAMRQDASRRSGRRCGMGGMSGDASVTASTIQRICVSHAPCRGRRSETVWEVNDAPRC